MRFTVLDSWRGLCALWVALYHFRVLSHVSESDFVRAGFIGVDFFFALSGFVISHAYGQGLADRNSRLRYLIRRFGRLYPLHIVVLGGVVCLELGRLAVSQAIGSDFGRPPFTDETGLPALAANVFLVHGLGFFETFTWNVPSWSISVELGVCVIYALASTWRRPVLSAAILALAGAAALQWAAETHLAEGRTALARGVCGFFLGVLAQRLFAACRARNWSLPGWVEWTAPLLFVAAAWLWEWRIWPGTPVLFATLVFIFAFEAGPLSRLLKRRPLLHLGEVSYSIYLIHYPMVMVVFGIAAAVAAVTGVEVFTPTRRLIVDLGGPWMGDLAILAFLALTVLIAGFTYRFIEAPGRDVFNRLSERFR